MPLLRGRIIICSMTAGGSAGNGAADPRFILIERQCRYAMRSMYKTMQTEMMHRVVCQFSVFVPDFWTLTRDERYMPCALSYP